MSRFLAPLLRWLADFFDGWARVFEFDAQIEREALEARVARQIAGVGWGTEKIGPLKLTLEAEKPKRTKIVGPVGDLERKMASLWGEAPSITTSIGAGPEYLLEVEVPRTFLMEVVIDDIGQVNAILEGRALPPEFPTEIKASRCYAPHSARITAGWSKKVAYRLATSALVYTDASGEDQIPVTPEFRKELHRCVAEWRAVEERRSLARQVWEEAAG